MAIFDRTWYGRVLVERVEGFATKEEWMRAYDEINEFERMLVDEGTLVIKFWMHISSEEQLKRFEERATRPAEALEADRRRLAQPHAPRRLHRGDRGRCSSTPTTKHAPWHVVPGDSKHYARVKVVETVNKEIEKAMRLHGIDPPS